MKLSDIGLAAVNNADSEKQREGRRRAVLSVKSYATVLQQCDGHPLPAAGSLAGRFEFEYGLSPVDAKTAAESFVGSVKHAEMLDVSGNVTVGDVLPESPGSDDSDETESPDAGAVPDVTSPVDDDPAPNGEPAPPPADAQEASRLVSGNKSSVEIAISINMTKWAVEDILTVLDVFGFARRDSDE